MVLKTICALVLLGLVSEFIVDAHSNDKTFSKVDGGWSDFGPWMACNKLCGEGGIQKRLRTCTNPPQSGGGKHCDGSSEIVKSCNSINCPTPCSFDGLTVQLLDIIGSDVKVNNHMVSALTKVVEAIKPSPSIPYRREVKLIRRIKHSLSKSDGEEKARRLFGVLLSAQKKCNYKRAIRKVKRIMGLKSLKKLVNADGAVSLIFTIDATGSMLPVIEQAKDFAKAIAEQGRQYNVNYILSLYGEPLSKKLRVKAFGSANQFIKAIDKIKPSLGEDCREPTFAGIIKAISKGHPKPGSPMYVFTNSPPKTVGQYTRKAAIDLARSSDIKVNLFLTDGKGFCVYQRPKPRKSRDYRRIIRGTGGVKLSFKDPSFINKLKNIVAADLDGSQILSTRTKNNLSTLGKRSYSNSKEMFTVDDICKRIKVLVTGDNVSNVTLSNPEGKEECAKMNWRKQKFWIVPEPRAGVWTLTKSSTVTDFTYEVKTSALLDISFTPRFKQRGSFIPHPLRGEEATVEIDVPNLSRLDENSLKFHFIADDGEQELSKNGDLYESRLPLSSAVRLRMTGKTLSGTDFERQSIPFQPNYGVLRAVTESRSLNPKDGTQFTIAIHYTGPVKRNFWFSAKSSKKGVSINHVWPKMVTVSKGESKMVFFSLSKPSGLDGEEVTITFQAKSDPLLLSLPIEFDEGWQ